MKGLYIGAAGMMNYMKHLDVHSNNIANSETAGFKFDQLTSQAMSRKQVQFNQADSAKTIGSVDYAVHPNQTFVNLKQGSMQVTGRDLDFFLHDADSEAGSSFFVAGKDGETFLTRGGSFYSDQNGFLKTSDGANLLAENGTAIQVGAQTKITVDTAGNIRRADTNELLGKLQTKFIAADQRGNLEKNGLGQLTLKTGTIQGLPAGRALIQNGVLESSNVDMSTEMVELMDNQRMVQASSNIIKMFDTVYDKESSGLLRN
ncbi:flagellar hook-basal body complex protein [Listeria grayi]|uniref:Flagellar basal body rod protein FlgG n=2 Tax=Listeria grayi TaxID=1641 RepID=D7V0D2_LISGR|nr:flagellar hook-basal body complex protein [Listeria grayi]EFI83025.1 flagellar basal body rod protein FlgG [Listeria grayi DSM 20601]STY43972.1 Distal rod protein [Listeria grayi]